MLQLPNQIKYKLVTQSSGARAIFVKLLWRWGYAESKSYWKVRDHYHYAGKYGGAAHSICNLKFNVVDEIPEVFHTSSNYNYHFIIKELANEYEWKIECLKENAEKYKTFSAPIEKWITIIDKLW